MSDGKWVHVSLPGHGTFWIKEDALAGLTDGALAPEEHIENGELKVPWCFGSDSYAHVWADGEISRYGNKIGDRGDLVRVEDQ